jgi:hypothetical protein
MENRKGEKIGWTAGWMGGFIWVAALSILFFFQGQYKQGVLGMALTGVAMMSIVFLSPWRFPSTPYWKLMLVPYGMFFSSIVWCIWSYGGLAAAGLNWWNLLWLVPLLTPVGILSHRKWKDSGQQSSPSQAAKPRS